jgi:lipopolysaccharide transport system permease protein
MIATSPLVNAQGSLMSAPVKNPKFWLTLGWLEVVQSYRRSFFGPLWITLNMVIFCAAMTLVYGALFGVQPDEYAAYIVCGMISWLWVSAMITDVGNAFIQYSQYIRGFPIDKSQFVWAMAYKHVVILGHNLIVYLAVVVLGVVDFNANTLLVVPAIAIVFLLSIPATAIMSILFARYQDVQRLCSSLTIIVMMLTPIFWRSDMITGWRSAFVFLNPFHYLIEFLRGPLLGRPPDPVVIAVVLGMTAIAWAVGILFYRRYQPYVVYWI